MPSFAIAPTVPTGPVMDVSGILPVINPPNADSIENDSLIVYGTQYLKAYPTPHLTDVFIGEKPNPT